MFEEIKTKMLFSFNITGQSLCLHMPFNVESQLHFETLFTFIHLNFEILLRF